MDASSNGMASGHHFLGIPQLLRRLPNILHFCPWALSVNCFLGRLSTALGYLRHVCILRTSAGRGTLHPGLHCRLDPTAVGGIHELVVYSILADCARSGDLYWIGIWDHFLAFYGLGHDVFHQAARDCGRYGDDGEFVRRCDLSGCGATITSEGWICVDCQSHWFRQSGLPCGMFGLSAAASAAQEVRSIA